MNSRYLSKSLSVFALTALTLATLSFPNSSALAAPKSGAKKAIATIKKAGLAKLPGAAKLAKRGSKKGKSSKAFQIFAGGSMPAIVDIPERGVSELFFDPGQIDRILSGNPTQKDCSTFFSGIEKGDAAGMGGCYTTQGVGYSFENLLSSGASVCYMQKMATVEGAVTLVGGELPEGGLKAVFAPPVGNTSRIVKVTVTGFPEGDHGEGEGPEQSAEGQDIFIEVASQGENQSAGRSYYHRIRFCEGGAFAPEYEEVSIKPNGEYTSKMAGGGGGNSTSTIKAFLTQEGGVTFDPNKTRIATIAHQGETRAFVSQLNIGATTISNKQIESGMFGDEAYERKSISFGDFTASNFGNLKISAAGYRELTGFSDRGFKSIIEFDPSEGRYVSDPDNSAYNARLNSVSLSDSFFAEPLEPEDVPELACDIAADVELSMDFSNPATAAIAQQCESGRVQNMDFCGELRSVEEAYFQNCNNGGGGGDPGDDQGGQP